MSRLTVCVATAAGLTALAFAAPAEAQRRPDTRTMSCAEGRALVQQSGAIVLTTGRYTYDRFVADYRYCPTGQVAETTWVETRDVSQCPIGNTCVMAPDREDLWWLRRHR